MDPASASSPSASGPGDPRVYMAAERTFLAWIRTAIALMAFGFVIARFGMFLRGIVAPGAAAGQGPGISLIAGVALIAVGILLCLVSAIRHRRYVRGIDEGRFREAFGVTVAFSVAGLLGVAGLGMVVLLNML